MIDYVELDTSIDQKFAFEIGIVGTIEEKQSYEYIHEVITQYKQESQGIAGSPKFDIWVQQGTSSHRFDIMDKSKFFFFFFVVLRINADMPNINASKSGIKGIYKCHQYHCTFILSN